MGAFSGNAGLLSLWFDEETWDWRFEFVNCRLGKQHIWWVVHVLDLITIGVAVAFGVLTLADRIDWTHSKPMLKAPLGDGKAKETDTKVDEYATIGPALVELVRGNGNLAVPDSGKKSLRKKKSRKTLNGSSPNGSVVSSK